MTKKPQPKARPAKPPAAPKATKARTAAHAAKPAAKPASSGSKTTRPAKARRSGLSAAAAALAEAGKPLSCKEILAKILEGGQWRTSGKTPEATLSAAIGREIRAKGPESRFKKEGRGLYAATGQAR